MGKVTIIIECKVLSSTNLAEICNRNLSALNTALELNAGDPDQVEISVVPDED